MRRRVIFPLLSVVALIGAFLVTVFLYQNWPNLGVYAQATPVLRPDQFFNGPLKSWGVVHDPLGRATPFTMDAIAHWNGGQGTQTETLYFPKGYTVHREWTFTKIDDDHFKGTAPDVVGKAKGESRGNALHWVYDIRIGAEGYEHVVHFDDWLFLLDETHLASFIRISKWGVPVGRITMFFEKDSSPARQ